MKARKGLALLLVILLLTALAGCGAKMEASADNGMYYDSAADMAPDYLYSDGKTEGVSNSTGLPDNQKWVRTMYLNAETEDMNPLLDTINQQVAALGGYVESREIYQGGTYSNYGYRNASLVIRIPVERADEFVAQVSGASNITSTSENVENITLTYVATESRIQALETEQTRLLELLAQAENMSDLLEIEARLTEVRYELENYTSQLRLYDNQVDYATVNLNIREVKVLTPQAKDGIGKRIASGFMENLRGLGTFLENLLVWFLAGLPWLVPLAAIVTGIVLLIRRNRKKKNVQKPEPGEAQA